MLFANPVGMTLQIGACTDDLHTSVKKIIVISEMIDGLLLKNYVLHYGVPTSTKVIIGWIREMLRGIAYLHQQGYIHRYITGDYKPLIAFVRSSER